MNNLKKTLSHEVATLIQACILKVDNIFHKNCVKPLMLVW